MSETKAPARHAIKLTKKGERAVKQGHPWIFDQAIIKLSADVQTGDLGIIFDQRTNRFLALGLIDLESPIRIKIIHHGSPTQIDHKFWESRIQTALKIRSSHFDDLTNGCRLIHGENDGFPGLILDQYADVLVLKIYSGIWLPYLNQILETIVDQTIPRAVVLRFSRNLARQKKDRSDRITYGTLNDPVVEFLENGIRFQANVIDGHKTGFFLDHRHNRIRIGKMSKEKRVLDVFCYAGGFSTHAAAGGAIEVTSLDLSQPAIDAAKKHVRSNAPKCTHVTICDDAFKAMSSMIKSNKQYDVVIVDPPSFAKAKNEVERALHQYRRLAELATQLTEHNGILMLASCSSRVSADDFFQKCQDGVNKYASHFELIDQTFHDIDHPISFPEGAYLKCGFWKIYHD